MRTTHRGSPPRGLVLALATVAGLAAGSAVTAGWAAEPAPPPVPNQRELPAPAKPAGVQASGARGAAATPASPGPAELAAAKGVAATLHRATRTAAKAPPAPAAGAKAPAVTLPAGLDRSGVVGAAPQAVPALAGADLAAATGVHKN